MAYTAARRGGEVVGPVMDGTETCDGSGFSEVRITVSATRRCTLAGLVGSADRVCYVTNTLRRAPEIEIVMG